MSQPHYLYPQTTLPNYKLFIDDNVYGTFWETNSNKRVVRVASVEGNVGPGIKMLVFWTHLNEDKDGHPRAYAPPTSATNWRPLPGLKGEDLIGNATSVRWTGSTTFHPSNDADPIKKNPWLWAGIQSAPAAPPGRRIDNRGPWLRDMAGNYPVFNPPGPNQDYYAPRTAFNTRAGEPVNPAEVPYGALSASLKYNGGVRLGDFGLAIARNGVSSPFVYADAGGEGTSEKQWSKNMGEVSTKLIENLGRPKEAVCFLVFPNSRRATAYAEPELMSSRVREKISTLNDYDNADELNPYLHGLLPALSRWGYLRGMQSWNLLGPT